MSTCETDDWSSRRDAAADGTAGDQPDGSRAGLFLARLTLVPALVLVSWLALALPLVTAATFTPLPAIALFVPVAVLVLPFALRAVRPSRTDGGRWGSWWTVAALLAVAVAFCALQLATCSEQIVVRRDPASYF